MTRLNGSENGHLSSEEILDLIENLTPVAQGWEGKCPLHDSKSERSLSIKEKPDGTLLLHCFAQNCEFEDILAALKQPKVSRKTVYSKPGYEWTDLAGNVVAVHQHKGPWYTPLPDGTWIAKHPIDKPLYNLPEVVSAIGRGERIFIVEGEKDVETLRNHGFVATTSGGATSWERRFAAFLQGADVVIVPDNDEDGKKYAAKVWQGVTKSASSIGCLVLEGLEAKEDVSDWFFKRGGTGGKLLQIAISELHSQFPFPKYRCGNGNESIIQLSTVPRPKGSQPHLIRDIVPETFSTVFFGDSGTLKTTLAAHLGLCVAAGFEHWLGFDIVKQVPVLFIDFELDQNTFVRKVYDLASGMGLDGLPNNLHYVEGAGRTTKEVFDEAVDFARENGIGLVIIDSLGIAMDGDMDSAKAVVKFMHEVMDRFKSIGVTSVMVDHQGKQQMGESYQSKTQYGNSFKKHLVRSQFQVEGKDGGLTIRHKKTNFGPLIDPFGVHINFEHEKITVEATELSQSELAEEGTVSIRKRILIALQDGPAFTDELADKLNAEHKTISNRVSELVKGGALQYTGRESSRFKEVELDRTNLRHLRNDEVFKERGNNENSLQTATFDVHSQPPEHTKGMGIGNEAVITTPEGISELVNSLSEATQIALDLETMPPAGWKDEVLAEYRDQLGKLKRRPKVDKRKSRLAKIKEKIRKGYATDTDVAVPRVISIAAGDVNKLVDVAAVDPTPLLDAIKHKILVTHNGAFDLGVLRSRYGYTHLGKVLDTQLLYTIHYYADGGERTKPHNGMWKLPDPRDTRVDPYGTGKNTVGMTALANVAHEHLGEPIDKESQRSDWSAPRLSNAQVKYALRDTAVLLDLVRVLIEKLEGVGMESIVDLEARAFAAMVDMSLNGFPADKACALDMAERYRVESEAALREVNELLPPGPSADGRPWNLNADAHVREILRTLGADLDNRRYPKTAKTREPSTSTDALRTLTKPEPVLRLVSIYLRYKALAKHHKDFASQYAGLIREDGTIKGSFDTVSTGRLSCRKPNLQQVPSRGKQQNEAGMRIRDIFRPRDGERFIVADFSQVELLIAGTVAARETGKYGHMLEVFQKGEVDVHAATAASLMGKSPEEVTKPERKLAKAVNFALIYGAKAETLQEYASSNYNVEMSQSEAEAYRKAFFERYPELAAWHKLVEAECKRGEEFSSTPMGRRRKLPVYMNSGVVAHTAAKNSPIQGAGADAIKLTMARLFEDRGNCPGNPRLNASVHDEVVLSVDAEHAGTAVEWVRGHMAASEREAVGDPNSPIVVDVDDKDSWGAE